MPAETIYRFKFRNSAAELVGVLGYAYQDGGAAKAGVRWLRYYKSRYGRGLAEFEILGACSFLDEWDENGQLEIWRYTDQWRLDFIALNVDDRRGDWSEGHEMRHYWCTGQRDLIDRAVIAWKAATTDRTKFTATAGETIMKSLVQYNATADATTANGRETTFYSPYTISIANDQARGKVIGWYCAWDELLPNLADLAAVAGGDFDLVRRDVYANKTQPTLAEMTEFVFEFYPDQLGKDRTADVIFSLGRGNMGAPQIRRRALNSPTVAVVGGPGTESDREMEIRTSDYHTAARHREVFVAAGNFKDADGRQAAGDRALADDEPTADFTWTVLQAASTRYGQHYFVGDLATVIRPDTGASTVQQLVSASVGLSQERGETIAMRTRQR